MEWHIYLFEKKLGLKDHAEFCFDFLISQQDI
jgi:hypothetical protein